MNQIPSVPVNPYMVQQQTAYTPVPQPKYNAVNIEINNPAVGTPGATQTAQYAEPTMPYYTYPQAPIYTYPQAPVQPGFPPVIQPPVVTQVPVQPTLPQETPAVPAQPVQPVDVKPEAPVVPAPVVTEPDTTTAKTDNKPEVVPADQVAPQVDLNSFIAKLANPDFDVQAAGMEDIAKLINETPEKATELVDSKVFDALTNIVNFDSSALEGPTKEQIAAREKVVSGKDVTDADKELANKITPKEQAERNKSYALFTTALMQKLYADEVKRLTNTTVPLTELPGATTVVDNLKDNPSPMVRASAIEALSYIQNPEYKKDLTTVFTIAQNDSDPGVAESAKIALEKLNQIQ